MTPITVYTTPTCGYCKMAKSYLLSKQLTFTERDITTDQQALDWVVNHTGQAAVPVLHINESIILGFDRPAIDAALQRRSP